MIAVDTNLLVHAHRRDAVFHQEAVNCLQQLAGDPAPWAVCYHSLIEFFGVVTRAGLWRTPSPPETGLDQIRAWKEAPTLQILTDNAITYSRLEQLVRQAKIRGTLIHDARIAACCLAHGVAELWTVDRDFSRFPDLKTSNPLV
ncbi:MAG: type II toxin-antitoxin system VapC family toxin [Opitutales bacterium]